MAERARVHAIEAVSGFRPALVQFVEECRSALVSAEADAGRTASRIRADRYPYWKKQIRVRQDELKRAKTELIMKQAMKDPDEARSTVEERKADLHALDAPARQGTVQVPFGDLVAEACDRHGHAAGDRRAGPDGVGPRGIHQARQGEACREIAGEFGRRDIRAQ